MKYKVKVLSKKELLIQDRDRILRKTTKSIKERQMKKIKNHLLTARNNKR